MNLIDVSWKFATEDQCLDLLETLRWPDGVRCPKFGTERVSRITRKQYNKNKRMRLYQCLACKGLHFSTTSGTTFADSHLPLTKWFLAIGFMLNAKKGLSAKQMQRDLGCGYQTAWYLCHRVRKAIEEGDLPKFTIREWARGKIHTNCIENFWSLFKRALMGSFHKVSVKHLPRYLAEFTYRFNRREEENLFVQTLVRLSGTATMPYRNVVANEQAW